MMGLLLRTFAGMLGSIFCGRGAASGLSKRGMGGRAGGGGGSAGSANGRGGRGGRGGLLLDAMIDGSEGHLYLFIINSTMHSSNSLPRESIFRVSRLANN